MAWNPAPIGSRADLIKTLRRNRSSDMPESWLRIRVLKRDVRAAGIAPDPLTESVGNNDVIAQFLPFADEVWEICGPHSDVEEAIKRGYEWRGEPLAEPQEEMIEDEVLRYS